MNRSFLLSRCSYLHPTEKHPLWSSRCLRVTESSCGQQCHWTSVTRDCHTNTKRTHTLTLSCWFNIRTKSSKIAFVPDYLSYKIREKCTCKALRLARALTPLVLNSSFLRSSEATKISVDINGEKYLSHFKPNMSVKTDESPKPQVSVQVSAYSPLLSHL